MQNSRSLTQKCGEAEAETRAIKRAVREISRGKAPNTAESTGVSGAAAVEPTTAA